MPTATVGEAIAPRLLSDAAITALVGQRVAPSKPNEEPTGDHISYWNSTGGDGMTLSGPEVCRWVEVRIEAVSETQTGAEAILAVVRTRLHGWRDLSVGVQGCFAQGDADESTLEDGRQISGQSFSVRFKPVA